MFVFHIINYVVEFQCVNFNRIHLFYTLTHTSTKLFVHSFCPSAQLTLLSLINRN